MASASDLAPLVAAVLRDRVVHDLVRENEEIPGLRDEVRRLRAEGPAWTLAVAGPGGTPVYATGTVLHRELLRKSGIDDGSIDVRGNGGTVVVVFDDGDAACRRDALRECRLLLTPEPGVGQEHAYNFGDDLHDDSKVWWMELDVGASIMACVVEFGDLGDLQLEVPILAGHNLGSRQSCTWSEVEANTDPGELVRFVGLDMFPSVLTGRVREFSLTNVAGG